jgi:hypothetical protein
LTDFQGAALSKPPTSPLRPSRRINNEAIETPFNKPAVWKAPLLGAKY